MRTLTFLAALFAVSAISAEESPEQRWFYRGAGLTTTSENSLGRAGEVVTYTLSTPDQVENVVKWYGDRCGLRKKHTLMLAADAGFASLENELHGAWQVYRDTDKQQHATLVTAHASAEHAHVTFYRRLEFESLHSVTVSISRTRKGTSIVVIYPRPLPASPAKPAAAKVQAGSLPTEPARVQLTNADGSPANLTHVVNSVVGFPRTSPALWIGSLSRADIVSLEGLPTGAHWLLAAGDSPSRLPFKVTIPAQRALLQRRLRFPEWWGKKVEIGRQPVVEVDVKAGEVIVVEIHNHSTQALRFSEADIVLVSQLEDELIRGLSPHWLTADREPFPETRIEAGQTGRMRLRWRVWARQGLWSSHSHDWSSRNHEPITEPGFPPNEPGKVWVTAGLGFAGSLPVSVTDPKLIPAKPEPQPAAVDPLENTPPRGVPKGNSEGVVIRVVGRIVDADSGEPINNVAWQFAQVDKSSQKVKWEPNFRLAHPLKDGRFDEMLPAGSNYQRRVIAAGYEPASLLDEVPNPLPDPPVIERTIRLKKGRVITGVLRDHLGKPAAGAQMFFIPQGHRAKIVEGFPGFRTQFPVPFPSTLRDHAVSESRTNDQGEFAIHAAGAGTLAASTDILDLWPFDLPTEGQPAELRLPAPATLTIDLSYWYLRKVLEKSKEFGTPETESPKQCWISVERITSKQPNADGRWEACDYRKEMLIFSMFRDPKLAKGVSVGPVHEQCWREFPSGEFRNEKVTVKIAIQLPPGNYQISRYRAGRGIDSARVVLQAGEESRLTWTRREGAAVQGTVKLPANAVFIQHPGAKPKKLVWSMALAPFVTIKSADGQVCEAARVTSAGTFFVATHLEPGHYTVFATASLPPDETIAKAMPGPPSGPELEAQQELVIPDVEITPDGSPPVRVELTMKSKDKRIVSDGSLESNERVAPDGIQPEQGESDEGFSSGRNENLKPLP